MQQQCVNALRIIFTTSLLFCIPPLFVFPITGRPLAAYVVVLSFIALNVLGLLALLKSAPRINWIGAIYGLGMHLCLFATYYFRLLEPAAYPFLYAGVITVLLAMVVDNRIVILTLWGTFACGAYCLFGRALSPAELQYFAESRIHLAHNSVQVFGLLAIASYLLNRRVRHYQSKLEETNCDLERRVAERTAKLQKQSSKLSQALDERTEALEALALSSDQLVIANKKANMANEAKSEFLARINHEIRNPLSAILNYCELLKIESQDDQQVQNKKESFVTGLNASASHLLSLVDDVLVVSEIENSNVPSNINEFELEDVVEEIHQITADQAKSKSLEFECSLKNNRSYRLVGDSTKLRQIVLNLLSNAIKFTETGTVRASFETVDSGEGQVELAIAVSDTGGGIPSELQPIVFDKFIRGNHSIDGTGLGLHICRRLVEALDGTIDFKSSVGSTVFQVKLPFEIAEWRSLSPSAVSGETDTLEEPLKILIVDDQKDVRETICLVLESAGFQAKASFQMPEVLELVKKWVPDLVLLDLRMPNNDGFEVHREIRKINEKICVVAITGDATAEVKRRCKQEGFNDFLTKPFRFDNLDEVLLKIRQETLSKTFQ